MERVDDGHIKLQELPRRDNFSLSAASLPAQHIRSPSSSPSHTCGYCKREFRSAQGLGGHMNVHRLDRARLIHHQCSPHRLAPPPNPNHSRTVLDLLGSGCCCCRTHGSASSDGGSAAAPAGELGTCHFPSMSPAMAKDFEVKNLELRMGACSHADGAQERLDLELRLGYS